MCFWPHWVWNPQQEFCCEASALTTAQITINVLTGRTIYHLTVYRVAEPHRKQTNQTKARDRPPFHSIWKLWTIAREHWSLKLYCHQCINQSCDWWPEKTQTSKGVLSTACLKGWNGISYYKRVGLFFGGCFFSRPKTGKDMIPMIDMRTHPDTLSQSDLKPYSKGIKDSMYFYDVVHTAAQVLPITLHRRDK